MTFDDMRQLEKGWDSYDADPPNEVAIGLAQKVLVECGRQAVNPERVMASVEGGVGISLYATTMDYAYVECLNDGALSGCVSVKDKPLDVWDFDNPTDKTIRSSVLLLKLFAEGHM